MPSPFEFLPLLADAVPPATDPASYQSVGWLLLSLAALVAAANQVMGFLEKIRSFRAQAPGDVSADRVKALEDRMHTLELSVATNMGEIKSQISNVTKSLTHIVSDFNYAIGKIDGRNETTHD